MFIPVRESRYESLFTKRLSMIELCLYAFRWLMGLYNHIRISDRHYTDVRKFAIQFWIPTIPIWHYIDVIMGAMASQITSLAIVYSTVYSDVDQRKHQSFASLAFVWGIHRGPGELPAQMASNAENVSISWRHHELPQMMYLFQCNQCSTCQLQKSMIMLHMLVKSSRQHMQIIGIHDYASHCSQII